MISACIIHPVRKFVLNTGTLALQADQTIRKTGGKSRRKHQDQLFRHCIMYMSSEMSSGSNGRHVRIHVYSPWPMEKPDSIFPSLLFLKKQRFSVLAMSIPASVMALVSSTMLTYGVACTAFCA